MISYYEVLGVAPYATKEEIEQAYRWLVQKFHPDRNAEFKEESKAQFVRIQEAFETLSDPLKRLQYDQELRRARQADPKATSPANTNESQATKVKRQTLAISPVWLTVVICFAVLGIGMILFKYLLDVPLDHNESTQSANVTPHSKTNDAPKAVNHEILPSGSVWNGAWIRYLPNQGAGDTSLTIKQRTGDTFQGEMHSDNDAHIWLVEGSAKGSQIEWTVNKAIKASDYLVGNSFNQGTINGNYIDVKWRLGNDSGVDLLKCDERPWDVGQQGDVKEMQIPGDAVEFNGHHYKYSDEKSTWYAAKRKCEKMGGHLICVGDAEEDSFAFTLIEKINAESAWIGANNEENQDVWVWVNGEPFSFSGWAPEQPDNWNGVGETCAAIWGSNTRLPRGWHDMSEGYRQGFICEWDY